MASLLRFLTPRSTSLSLPFSWPRMYPTAILRSFSSSSTQQINAYPDTKRTPPYPHGFNQWYKQSNRGLYGHVRIRTNARVSGKFPAQRTIKRWRPNVHRKRLYSKVLGRYIRVKLVIRLLRTIDKVGGIDNYLLGQTPGRIKEMGPTGWALRWRLLRTDKGKAVWEEERKRLGLGGLGPRDEGWIDPVAVVPKKLHREATQTAEEVTDDEYSEEQLIERERRIDEILEREDELGERGGLEIGSADSERTGRRDSS